MLARLPWDSGRYKVLLWECQTAFLVSDQEDLDLENFIFPSSETGCYNARCRTVLTSWNTIMRTAARWIVPPEGFSLMDYIYLNRPCLTGGLILPKSETAKGLAYSIDQEEYLKVFLTDGEVTINDSASERAFRNL